MSSTPREIGTLIVVILKAKHLPNKRHIGKQDPYCVVSLDGEKRRTKAVKRGGQHPEWDEEVRFTLYEDEDQQPKVANDPGTPPPPPPKTISLPGRVRGGTGMLLSCYADDPREPDFIGECTVDMTEVLTKGETDEWFTLHNKDKYCGEVYLELTFWSNESPPEKKPATPKTSKPNKQYGGPGSFVPSGDLPSLLASGQGSHSSHIMSTSSTADHSRQSSVPSSLRASNSVAQIDLYVPPYEKGHGSPAVDRIATDFGEMRVSDLRRRESFPPPHGVYAQRPSSIMSPSTPSPYDQNRYSDTEPNYLYDRPRTPQANAAHHRNSISGSTNSYQSHLNYHPAYDPVPTPYPSQSSVRPRISITSNSSGFIPLQSHPSSNFFLPSHPSESTGFIPLQNQSSQSFTSLPSHGAHMSDIASFAPPPSQTPVPFGYHPSQYNHHTGFAPVPTATPAPAAFTPSLPPSSSAPFQQPSFVPSSSFHLPQYPSQPPASMVTHQYPAAQPPASSQLPLPNSQQMQPMYSAATPSPTQESMQTQAQIAPQNNISSSAGSRPLPHPLQQIQPTMNPQPQAPYNPPPPPSLPATTAYQAVPPPPPLPLMNSVPNATSQQLVSQNVPQQPNSVLPVPPPPPPPLLLSGSLSRRPALPQPPFGAPSQQQTAFQSVPPPPPPPPNLSQSNAFPPAPPHLRNASQTYYPAPQHHAPWPAQ